MQLMLTGPILGLQQWISQSTTASPVISSKGIPPSGTNELLPQMAKGLVCLPEANPGAGKVVVGSLWVVRILKQCRFQQL